MIYDCVTLFNDVELLDLRFMTLYDHVDYFVIGDIDEIANPVALKEGISKYEQFGLLQKLFYYYVNCQAVQMWYGSMCWKRKYITSPQDVRNRRGGEPNSVDNGGWHYSFLGGAERIMLKLKSFEDTEIVNRKLISL